MNVLAWRLSLVSDRGVPNVCLTLASVCPVCNTNRELSHQLEITPGRVKNWPRDSLSYLLGYVARTQVCAVCGVHSDLPATHKNQLNEEASELITAEAIGRSLEGLDLQVVKKWGRTPAPNDYDFKFDAWILHGAEEDLPRMIVVREW